MKNTRKAQKNIYKNLDVVKFVASKNQKELARFINLWWFGELYGPSEKHIHIWNAAQCISDNFCFDEMAKGQMEEDEFDDLQNFVISIMSGNQFDGWESDEDIKEWNDSMEEVLQKWNNGCIKDKKINVKKKKRGGEKEIKWYNPLDSYFTPEELKEIEEEEKAEAEAEA